MRLTDDQIGAAIDAVVEALHTDGITVDVSSVRAGDGVLLTVTIEGAGDSDQTGTVQVLPETSSGERMHVLDETCWCRPTVESFGETLVHSG